MDFNFIGIVFLIFFAIAVASFVMLLSLLRRKR